MAHDNSKATWIARVAETDSSRLERGYDSAALALAAVPGNSNTTDKPRITH